MIKGEPMPDQNDPRYQEKREQAQNAGKRFAEIVKLDSLAFHVQVFANNHRKTFLVVFMSLIGFMLFISLARTINVITSHREEVSAVEAQHRMLEKRRGRHLHRSPDNPDAQSFPEYREIEKN